jgi:hypothetical protein
MGSTLIFTIFKVFDLTKYAPSHLTVTQVIPTKSVLSYGGIDASSLFPVQVSQPVEALVMEKQALIFGV